LLKSAIRDDNPVIFCVHKHLYGSKGRKVAQSQLSSQYVPQEEYTIALGVADVKRAGEDITVVANLVMLHHALNAAEKLEAEGIHAEVIDPRTLVPFDHETVLRSVGKTRRLLIVEESPERAGWGAHLAAVVASGMGTALRAPLRRLATPDVPIPFSPVLEAAVLPGQADIEKAIRELVAR
jgi:pyruvate dehydrogenase E1 component beta subunit